MGLYADLAAIKLSTDMEERGRERVCSSCGHRWISRRPPTVCPNQNCRSPRWYKESERKPCHCLRCDHDWVAFTRRPKACPGCGSPSWQKKRVFTDAPPGKTAIEGREKEAKSKAEEVYEQKKCGYPGCEDWASDLGAHWGSRHGKALKEINKWLGHGLVISDRELGISGAYLKTYGAESTDW